MNIAFYLNVADYMLPKPNRRYCKPVLYEDDVEMPIILVESGEG